MQVEIIKTHVESAFGVCNQRLKLECDEPLSNVAFKFNLRRYVKVAAAAVVTMHVANLEEEEAAEEGSRGAGSGGGGGGGDGDGGGVGSGESPSDDNANDDDAWLSPACVWMGSVNEHSMSLLGSMNDRDKQRKQHRR